MNVSPDSVDYPIYKWIIIGPTLLTTQWDDPGKVVATQEYGKIIGMGSHIIGGSSKKVCGSSGSEQLGAMGHNSYWGAMVLLEIFGGFGWNLRGKKGITK